MDEDIQQFMAFANCSPEEAKFYLESADGNIQDALAMFFDSGFGSMPSSSSSSIPPKSTSGRNDHSKSNRSGNRPRIGGMSEILNAQEEEEKEEAKKENDYYAGGSSSGMVVRDPHQEGSDKAEDIVKNVFEGARRHGASEQNQTDFHSQSQSFRSFEGNGYQLGDDTQPPSLVSSKPTSKQRKILRLVFWENGFSVDTDNGDEGRGPLRKYDDPINRRFLEDVRKGLCPIELEELGEGQGVSVEMDDRKREKYIPPPKPKLVPFSGSGQSLSSSSPSYSRPQYVTSSSTQSKKIVVDDSLPKTTIQVRLPQGNRLVIKCNMAHTVQDLRSHIMAVHPEFRSQSFTLSTSFPKAELKEYQQTVESAGLKQAAILLTL
eukprot:GCRY01003119.1.p1 GENE.GCRY01003119.1~~GCRY01003119.1.p1  ORF type:complete len:377 (+),score=57.70 GCRY01003119.1:57-1187(+)